MLQFNITFDGTMIYAISTVYISNIRFVCTKLDQQSRFIDLYKYKFARSKSSFYAVVVISQNFL